MHSGSEVQRPGNRFLILQAYFKGTVRKLLMMLTAQLESNPNPVISKLVA